MIRKIALGCDHGAFALKEELIKRLTNEGYEIVDKGIKELHEVDYPDIAETVARAVVAGQADCGILCCGTGIGVSIAANKVGGVRAALCADCFSAKMAREHNNANIITLGARTTGVELAWEIVKAYLGASYLGGKHGVRVEKIDAIKP